jgi:hypothetical protein
MQEQLEKLSQQIKEIANPSLPINLPPSSSELLPTTQTPVLKDDYPWIDPPSPRILKAERRALKEIERR